MSERVIPIMGDVNTLPPPMMPDLSGCSRRTRQGKKRRRRVMAAFYRARAVWRRIVGLRPLAGPPVNFPYGVRPPDGEYHTLSNARHGGRKSGWSRRKAARERHQMVFDLDAQGLGCKLIAKATGYSHVHVRDILRGRQRTFAGRPSQGLDEQSLHTGTRGRGVRQRLCVQNG